MLRLLLAVPIALLLGEVAVRHADRMIAREVSGVGEGCDFCGRADTDPWTSSLLGRVRGSLEHSCCGARVSARGALPQLALVAIAVALAMGSEGAGPRALAGAVLVLVAASIIVSACAVNAELMIFPRKHVIAALAFAIAGSWASGAPMRGVLASGAIAFAAAHAFRFVKGATSLGAADAQIWGVVGAMSGLTGAVFFILASMAVGVVVHGFRSFLGFEIPLPTAVRRERDLLQEDADAGDEDARRTLAEDPAFADADADVVATGPLYAVGLGAFFVARDIVGFDMIQIGTSFGFLGRP
jgi:hypothetical protein